MSDRFLFRLRQIEKEEADRISIYEDGSAKFYNLVKTMSGRQMSINDYAKVLEMFYLRYSDKRKSRIEQTSIDKSKASMYCILQLQRLYLAKDTPALQIYYPNITFEEPLDQNLLSFVERKRPFYSVLVKGIQDKWIAFGTVMGILVLAVLCLVFNLSYWLSLLISLLVIAGFVYYGFTHVVNRLVDDRLHNMSGKLDSIHQSFEKQMRAS